MRKSSIKHLLLALLLVLTFSLQAEYYDNVINLTGQPLFNGLRTLISNNTNTSYDTSKEVLFQTLDNVGGNVTCVYTGQVYNVGYSYTGSSNPNTEHTYAQSWFTGSDTNKKKSDLHHLFVTNSTVNSSRGNYPFDVVANHSSATVYYTNTPRQSYRGTNASGRTVFEPADQFKGNIARALLYFYTRYSGESLSQQNVDMLPTLLQWHVADPPDAAEVTRNNGVFAYQNNRNPYVDHPEFVGRIWGTANADYEMVMGLDDLQIDRVYPNPFSSGLAISMESKNAASCSTTIYNLKGQKVYYEMVTIPAGKSEWNWNGLDKNGTPAPSGLYFVAVDNGSEREVKRVIKQ